MSIDEQLRARLRAAVDEPAGGPHLEAIARGVRRRRRRRVALVAGGGPGRGRAVGFDGAPAVGDLRPDRRG